MRSQKQADKQLSRQTTSVVMLHASILIGDINSPAGYVSESSGDTEYVMLMSMSQDTAVWSQSYTIVLELVLTLLDKFSLQATYPKTKFFFLAEFQF